MTAKPEPDDITNPSEAADERRARNEGKHPLFPRLPSLARIMSVVMLMFGILAVGALFYRVMAGFFVPLFLAALLVVIFRPVHEWIIHKLGDRPRVASVVTTTLILTLVLLPVMLLLSVAASQFTAMVSQVNLNSLTQAIDRAREQFSLSLPHAGYFRRLDELADSLDQPDQPEQVLASIDEASKLVAFLQREVDGPPGAEPAAVVAQESLKEFTDLVRQSSEQSATEETSLAYLDAADKFHRQSVKASASIRTWMREKLGGTFYSQLKLLANPSEAAFTDLLRRGRETLQPRFVRLTSATGGFLLQAVIGTVVLVIAVYFFLIDGPAMIRTLMRLSPLDDNYEHKLLLEFDRTSRAVVLASVLSALAQGILAAIAFYFLGLQSVVLLFLATSLMALVPFLGAASVWVPCAIWLGAVEQRWGAAIFLAIYGALVVSSIDNVIKVFVLHGRSQLHPLLALLSVLGGVKVFGPIGILVGPMVVVFLQTLLEILNHELEKRDPSELRAEGSEAT